MSVRTIVSVIGIAAVFGAAVFYGGDYVGAWDPVEPPPRSSAGPEEEDEATTTAKAPTTTAEDPEAAPSTAPPAPTAPTAADSRWLEQANALCRRSVEEVAGLPQPTTQKEAKTVLAQAVDLNAFYNDEFAALGAPPGGAVAFAELLVLFEREERLLGRMLAALQENRMGEFFRLSDRVIPLTLEEDDLLYKLGAESCTVSLVPELSF